MKTKGKKHICNHCGKSKAPERMLNLGVVNVATAEILDRRNICTECWDRASYGSVTGLSVGKLDW